MVFLSGGISQCIEHVCPYFTPESRTIVAMRPPGRRYVGLLAEFFGTSVHWRTMLDLESIETQDTTEQLIRNMIARGVFYSMNFQCSSNPH